MVRTFLAAVCGIVVLLVAKQVPGPIGDFAGWAFGLLGSLADAVTNYLRQKGFV